jgi:hypothetical protein
MVVLVDGVPQTLSLKGILQEFIKHRQEVVRRRTSLTSPSAGARAYFARPQKGARPYRRDHQDHPRIKGCAEAHKNLDDEV